MTEEPERCDVCGRRVRTVRERTLRRFRSLAGYWQSDTATLCLRCYHEWLASVEGGVRT